MPQGMPDSEVREAALRDQVREIYAVFRGYKLQRYIAPDPCFPGFCDDRPLRAGPLDRLPPAAFDMYQWKAVTTWGSVDDFKHFLPRLLEIIALVEPHGSLRQVEPWLIFSRMNYAEWYQWRAREREVLDGYFDALWSALLARPLASATTDWTDETLGDWLSHFANAHDDLSRFREVWQCEAARPTDGLMAAAHLADTVVAVSETAVKRGKLDWDEGLDCQEQETLAWLTSDRICRMLEEAFFRWAPTPYAQILSEGHYWLDLWRRQRSGDG